MARETNDVGPKLGALLDERDHLRIKISMNEDEHGHEVAMMRRRLLQLEYDILKGWAKPHA